jgi:hypothetical protein
MCGVKRLTMVWSLMMRTFPQLLNNDFSCISWRSLYDEEHNLTPLFGTAGSATVLVSKSVKGINTRGKYILLFVIKKQNVHLNLPWRWELLLITTGLIFKLIQPKPRGIICTHRLIKRAPKVTSLAWCTRAKWRTSYANFARYICVTYALDSRRMRAPAARGARNKGCYVCM